MKRYKISTPAGSFTWMSESSPILLHSNTKKAKAFRWYYDRSFAKSLDDVYKTCSHEKRMAQYEYIRMMYYEGGHDFRIMSANTFRFTCGWVNPDGTFRVETGCNSYVIADKFAGIDK